MISFTFITFCELGIRIPILQVNKLRSRKEKSFVWKQIANG